MEDGFEWDPEKDRRNQVKHGIDFSEAGTVFFDPLVEVRPDDDHSSGEPRSIAMGRSWRQRLVVVVFTERGERIRIISARRATRRETSAYEG